MHSPRDGRPTACLLGLLSSSGPRGSVGEAGRVRLRAGLMLAASRAPARADLGKATSLPHAPILASVRAMPAQYAPHRAKYHAYISRYPPLRHRFPLPLSTTAPGVNRAAQPLLSPRRHQPLFSPCRRRSGRNFVAAAV